MPDEQGRAQRPAGIARGRLDPYLVERPFAQQTTVGHAVQGHAARHHQALLPRLGADVPAHSHYRLFGHGLNAGRQVAVSLLDPRFGRTRRTAEQPVKAGPRHGEALAEIEVIHVQPQAAIRLEVDQVLADQVPIDRSAIRRQAHQLVFTAVDLETTVVGERRIQQPERMGELQMVGEPKAIAGTEAVCRRTPLADAVEREDRRLVERAREEGARGVALMVIGEHDGHSSRTRQGLSQQAAHVELVPEPYRHRLREAQESARREGQVGLDQPVELHERLVVEGEVVEPLRREPRLGQAIRDRSGRKARVVLSPREPLFLRRGDGFAVDHERRRTVVIERRDTEDCGQRSTLLRHVAASTDLAFLARVSAPARRRFPESFGALALARIDA